MGTLLKRLNPRIIPFAVIQILMAIAALFGLDLRRVASVFGAVSRAVEATAKLPADLIQSDYTDKPGDDPPAKEP